MSSGDTRPERSGSSPYQKIQSSLAAVRESGGGAGEGAMPRSKMPAPGAEAAALAAAAGPAVAGVAATRRHTHRMSPAKHREKLDNTGSSRGVPPNPPATSPHTSFLHFIPQRDVWKIKRNISDFAYKNHKCIDGTIYVYLFIILYY